MGFAQDRPTTRAEDIMECVYRSETSVMYHTALHTDLAVYQLREQVKAGVVKLYKFTSAD